LFKELKSCSVSIGANLYKLSIIKILKSNNDFVSGGSEADGCDVFASKAVGRIKKIVGFTLKSFLISVWY